MGGTVTAGGEGAAGNLGAPTGGGAGVTLGTGGAAGAVVPEGNWTFGGASCARVAWQFTRANPASSAEKKTCFKGNTRYLSSRKRRQSDHEISREAVKYQAHHVPSTRIAHREDNSHFFAEAYRPSAVSFGNSLQVLLSSRADLEGQLVDLRSVGGR